jgi:hypothetical protein
MGVSIMSRSRHRQSMPGYLGRAFAVLALLGLGSLTACTSVNTFPTVARAGDTVSVMVGGSQNARKSTIAATLTDNIGQNWDLQAQGLIRSVFNLRTDGVAYGKHYSSYNESFISWAKGHEPVQTVLVVDIPAGAAPGPATLTINPNVNDNSSDISGIFSVHLEIIPGTGASDSLLRQAVAGNQPVDFTRLEPAPYAKVTFSDGGQTIGAATLVINFDSAVVNADDIDVYVPEANVRGSFSSSGPFGETQRMVYWHVSGPGQLTIDAVAPQGVLARFLQFYVVHPRNLSGPINFALSSATVYDVNGVTISDPPALQYSP